jgi:hypothetical protein
MAESPLPQGERGCLSLRSYFSMCYRFAARARGFFQCANASLLERPLRHGRACPGHPRGQTAGESQTWMPGTSAGHDDGTQGSSTISLPLSPWGEHASEASGEGLAAMPRRETGVTYQSASAGSAASPAASAMPSIASLPMRRAEPAGSATNIGRRRRSSAPPIAKA